MPNNTDIILLIYLVSPNLNILEKHEITVIEHITLSSIETPFRAIVISSIPPEISRDFLMIKLSSIQIFKGDVSIATCSIVDFDKSLLKTIEAFFQS